MRWRARKRKRTPYVRVWERAQTKLSEQKRRRRKVKTARITETRKKRAHNDDDDDHHHHHHHHHHHLGFVAAHDNLQHAIETVGGMVAHARWVVTIALTAPAHERTREHSSSHPTKWTWGVSSVVCPALLRYGCPPCLDARLVDGAASHPSKRAHAHHSTPRRWSPWEG